MQTHFSAASLESDPRMQVSARAVRACVHCGFCNATCPTYGLLGDELDGPRGRIMLIKDMLERQVDPSSETVTHLDRCLSCLSCTSTCPSGVDYMHLIDHARAYVDQRVRRPWFERFLRGLLALLLPHPRRFALALRLGRWFAPLAVLLPKVEPLRPVRAMLDLARLRLPASAAAADAPLPDLDSVAAGAGRRRIAFLRSCAEPVLAPGIQRAAERLVARMGYSVVEAPGQGCCGALVHHMGREEQGLAFARANVAAWSALIEDGDLDAIVVTASGCGTTLKDYGHWLRDDPVWAQRAAEVSRRVQDISEFVAERGLPETVALPQPQAAVAYHAACSLQHGQKVRAAPRTLLQQAGFEVRDPTKPHLCCGSAGTYNILQSEYAEQLRRDKLERLNATDAAMIATGNIGCLVQLSRDNPLPVVHTVELLDWATGGPQPPALRQRQQRPATATA